MEETLGELDEMHAESEESEKGDPEEDAEASDADNDQDKLGEEQDEEQDEDAGESDDDKDERTADEAATDPESEEEPASVDTEADEAGLKPTADGAAAQAVPKQSWVAAANTVRYNRNWASHVVYILRCGVSGEGVTHTGLGRFCAQLSVAPLQRLLCHHGQAGGFHAERVHEENCSDPRGCAASGCAAARPSASHGARARANTSRSGSPTAPPISP